VSTAATTPTKARTLWLPTRVRRPGADAAVACLLGLLGFCIAASYMRAYTRSGGVAEFGQREFSAAIAVACGRGFVNLGYDATPGLVRFLARDSDTFSCRELSPDIGGELNVTQRLYPYLMTAAGLVWRVMGISWSGLWPLYGVLFGCTIASAYGLFRLAAARPIAIAASLALALSAVQLGHLPPLRDYAKAPFMLALLLVMARLATDPVSPRRVLAGSVAFGVVLGIGFGFRNDLLINILPFTAVVLLCLPGGVAANLRLKSAALGAAALAFAVCAWPIVKGYRAGSNSGHVALLGLMSPLDKPLGIRPSFYDFGYAYNDMFAANIVTAYGYWTRGQFFEFLSNDYDHQAVAYLLQIARHWPADILARAYASVLKILEMPFAIGMYAYSIPFAVNGSRLTAVYDWQIWLVEHLSGRGIIIAAAALTIVGARSLRAGITLLLFLLFYAGYPAIQFGARHFFQLEFIGWCALAFVIQQGASFVGNVACDRPESLRAWLAIAGRPMIRAAVFLAVAGGLIAGSLTTVRAYQAGHVRGLVHGYLEAPRERLELDAQPLGGSGKAFVTARGLWELSAGEAAAMPVRMRYLVAEFASATACGAAQLPVRFRYSYQDKTSDLSRDVILNLAAPEQPTAVFLPVYYNHTWSSGDGPAGSHFDGIELPGRHAGCLEALYRIADVKRYPLLLGMTLPPDWEKAVPFQTVETIERSRASGHLRFYTVPADLVVTRAAITGSVHSISADVTGRARMAAPDAAGAWAAKGRADAPRSTLLEFRERVVPRHAVLVAEGELRAGGVSFALQSSAPQSVRVSVVDPGRFVVALEAPAAGPAAVVIANDIVPWWPASHIGRRVGPFVGWIPGATLRTDVVVSRIGWLDHPVEEE
jgi:hypothetical protein